MELLQPMAIALEIGIAFLCLRAALRSNLAWSGLALTFAIYVWYDLVRYLSWPVDATVQSGVFLVATLSALYTVWRLTRH